jgi:hypothetical protein
MSQGDSIKIGDSVAEQRGEVLTRVMQDAENNMIKQARGDANRKNKWLSQLITFRRVNVWGKCPAGCEWKIERRKMTPKLVQDLVRRSPLPCEIDFFIDANGDSVYLSELQMKGMCMHLITLRHSLFLTAICHSFF